MNYGGEFPGVRNVFIIMIFVSLLLSLLICVVLTGVCWNYDGSVEHNRKWLPLGSHYGAFFYCSFFIPCTLFSIP